MTRELLKVIRKSSASAITMFLLSFVCGIIAVFGMGKMSVFCLEVLKEAWVPRTVIFFILVHTVAWGLWLLVTALFYPIMTSRRRYVVKLRAGVERVTYTAIEACIILSSLLAGVYVSTLVMHFLEGTPLMMSLWSLALTVLLGVPLLLVFHILDRNKSSAKRVRLSRGLSGILVLGFAYYAMSYALEAPFSHPFQMDSRSVQ